MDTLNTAYSTCNYIDIVCCCIVLLVTWAWGSERRLVRVEALRMRHQAFYICLENIQSD